MVIIPLNDKDAEELRKRNSEQEDERRRRTAGSKPITRRVVQGPSASLVSQQRMQMRPGQVPSLYPFYSERNLRRMMEELPFGNVRGSSSRVMGTAEDAEGDSGVRRTRKDQLEAYYTRVKNADGKYENVPVYGLGQSEEQERRMREEARQRKAINSIKFDQYGDAYVNGKYAPELTNSLKSIIRGTLEIPKGGLPTGSIFTEPPKALEPSRRSNMPTGVTGYDAFGRPVIIRKASTTGPLIVDGVRITDSLLKTYVTQLEKKAGTRGAILPGGTRFGQDLYDRLFPPKPTGKEVFVFGSNLKGIHGKGAALTAAREYGAIRGQGIGPQGNAYAIPTKSTPSQTLPLPEIKKYVDEFLDYAKANPGTRFNLTAIGTGLAGYKVDDIAPMFKNAPSNVIMPKEFGGTREGYIPKPLSETSQVKEGRLLNIRKMIPRVEANQVIDESIFPKNAVYIGRGMSNKRFDLPDTPWGNPFRIMNKEEKDLLREAIKSRQVTSDEFLKEGIKASAVPAGKWGSNKQKLFDTIVDRNIQNSLKEYEKYARNKLKNNPNWLDPLVGKDMVDWCQPGKCHGDVLRKLINERVGGYYRGTPDERRLERYRELQSYKRDFGEAGLDKKEQKELNFLKNYFLKQKDINPELTPQLEGRTLQEDLNPDDPNASFKDRAPVGTKDVQSKYPPNSQSPRFGIQAIANTDGAPGVYIDGEYDGKLTYSLVSAMTNIKKNPKTWQRIKQQGGSKIGGVFVSISEMEKFSKSIPANMEVVYDKDGKVTMKPRTTGGAAFRTLGATTNALGIIVNIGDIIRLTQEWLKTKPRPIT